jgi:hypothetical protein
MPGGAYWRQILSIASAWYVAAATERVWKADTVASVTGSNPSRSYWHSTETVLPASAAATPFSKSGSCSTPVTGRSAQLMSTATRRPGKPSCRQAGEAFLPAGGHLGGQPVHRAARAELLAG